MAQKLKSPKFKDEEFIADSKAAILTRTTPIANIILLVAVIFFVIGFIWAYFAEIDVSAKGTGTVLPYSYVKVIQSLDGGILEKILVREGDFVKKNQPLAILDATRYTADFKQGYAKYIALVAMTSRLSAEAHNQTVIKFPTIVEKYPDLIKRETELFQARKKALATQLADLQESYNLALKQVKILEPVVKEGLASKLELLQDQREASTLKGQINQATNKFREDAAGDLNIRLADLSIVKENLISLRDKMIRTTIVSPINGIIKKINIVTEGGVIQPGMNIMEIVPQEDHLIIQAKIDPKDIAFIHVGQPASVKIVAYDFSIYGDLKGTVNYVSPDTIEEKNAVGNTISYYTVKIITKNNYLMKDQQKLPIMAGMTANVQILTGKKTILQYLLKPLIKAKTEALQER